MPRILLLITDLQIGGTPTVVRELAIRLSASGGMEIEVACLSWGPVADQIQSAGISVSSFDARGASDFPRVAGRLMEVVGDHQIDTVVSFLVHANTVAAAASRLSKGVRWIQSIQTTQPTPAWHWKIQSFAQHAAERIVVPSPSVARVAMDWAHVPCEKIVVIPNAVDVDQFAPPRDRTKDTGGPLVPRVGFIGRLDPVKRVTDLVEATTLLDPLAHLHIYGEGADRPNIETAIRRFNVERRVTLHGSISLPQHALADIDVLVLPSRAEGFGLVLIEAMAAGVPVVATDVPGISDIVRNGETGLLVPVASPATMAKAITSLLNDPSLRGKLIANAAADVRHRFSWEVVLPQYQRLLLNT